VNTYSAYGLGIRSELPLPELVAGGAGEDVLIRLGKVDGLPPTESRQANCRLPNGEGVYLFEKGVGSFQVRKGREIVVDPGAGADPSALRYALLGPAFGILLLQRGLLVLHASAVEKDGHVVAFLGQGGQGKSTLAAALYGRGYSLVSDDVTAIDTTGAVPRVVAAFPWLKLWPDSVLTLGRDPQALSRIEPQEEKRALGASRSFPRSPLPLGRLYVLANGTRPESEPLPPRQAFLELTRYSYADAEVVEGATAAHFHQCAWLAGAVAVHRLKRQRCLAALPELAEFVAEEVARA
jgi:hypothetical protein